MLCQNTCNFSAYFRVGVFTDFNFHAFLSPLHFDTTQTHSRTSHTYPLSSQLTYQNPHFHFWYYTAAFRTFPPHHIHDNLAQSNGIIAYLLTESIQKDSQTTTEPLQNHPLATKPIISLEIHYRPTHLSLQNHSLTSQGNDYKAITVPCIPESRATNPLRVVFMVS